MGRVSQLTGTAKCLSLALAAFAGLLHAQDRVVTIDVRAQEAWRRTGIQVPPGATVLLQAVGSIEAVPPGDNRPEFHRVPPEGRPLRQPNKPQPLMRSVALLARIGDGPVWEAGAQAEVTAGDPYGSGELQLGINDDYVADNSGTWTVRVTIRNAVSATPFGGRDRRDTRIFNRQQDAGAVAIDQKARELGNTIGSPLAEVQPTRDGVGRVRLFQNVSIYWHPSTGAHEVHGGIREKWNSMGAEGGSLGYPVSDETNGRDGRSRVSRFQNGSIIYDNGTGATRVQEAR